MQKKKLNKQDLFTIVMDLIIVIIYLYGMSINPGDIIYFFKFIRSLYIFTYKFSDIFLKNEA